MAINECGEIVREEMKQKCLGKGNLKIMSRKEHYEYLSKEVSKAQQELWKANTEKSVNEALDKLAELMNKLSHDSQVAEVNGYIADISSTIQYVKLHDITRSVMMDMLQRLLDRVQEIIAEEKKRENAGKLRKLFLELAEHSEQIAEIIDINKIFD